MRAEIIPIGNSKGIRLSKSIIEQCGFQKTVDVEVVDQHLVITAANQPRQGWGEKFSLAGLSSESFEGLQDLSNKWDEDEWQW